MGSCIIVRDILNVVIVGVGHCADNFVDMLKENRS